MTTQILDGLNSSAAYSLRKLRTAYLGAAINVRRSSDSATQDIGFVNNNLDTASLLAFVGNGNGFVRTWYDQSGNGRNATQTLPLGQPQIVINGVIQTQNGRPTVVQSIQDQTLPISGSFTGSTSATGVFVFRQLTGNAGAHGFRFQFGAVNNHAPWQDGRAYDSFFSSSRQVFNSYGPNTIPSTTTLTIHTARQTGTALQVFKNGTQIDGNKTVSFQLPDAPSLFTLGALGTAAVSEAIVFGTAISTTDRKTIERNQGQYYGIPICGADYDFTFLSSGGMPGFQGNCFLVTNEQIRWLQLNNYIPNTSTAPDNKSCPTKSQFEEYIGGFGINRSAEYIALANNNCVPIGYWYPTNL
jgi:hypothetical protein